MQENRAALPEPLKAVVGMIEDIRRTTRETESRVKSLDTGLSKLEAELERQLSVQERVTREIRKLKSELETLKAEAAMTVNEQTITAVKKQMPAAETASNESGNSEVEVQPILVPEISDKAAVQPIPAPEISDKAAVQPIPAPEIPDQPPAETRSSELKIDGLPVMPGSGFSHITYGYLKTLTK